MHSVNAFLVRPGFQNALKHTVGRVLGSLVDEVQHSAPAECSGTVIIILKLQSSSGHLELVESGQEEEAYQEHHWFRKYLTNPRIRLYGAVWKGVSQTLNVYSPPGMITSRNDNKHV